MAVSAKEINKTRNGIRGHFRIEDDFQFYMEFLGTSCI